MGEIEMCEIGTAMKSVVNLDSRQGQMKVHVIWQFIQYTHLLFPLDSSHGAFRISAFLIPLLGWWKLEERNILR